VNLCRAADRLDLAAGVTVPVAQAGHLIATKLLAIAPDRPQDAMDLRALRTHLTDRDRELAREAVARIEERGANRSKRLREDFERWLDADQ
jgi:predicted nucleotidyltransferase